MRETHFANPYHRVGWWNGKFHQKGWLRDVGVAIFLCEHADPYAGTYCPSSVVLSSLPPGFDEADPEGYDAGPNNPADPYLDTEVGPGLEDDEVDTVHHSEADNNDHLATLPPDPGDVESSTRQIADEVDEVTDNASADQRSSQQRGRGRYPRQDPRGLAVMVIGDVSHMHGVGVQFCSCPGARPRDEQLLEYGIYPASANRPSTGFTLHNLDYLRLDEVECKTSPDAYSRKLRRLTDSHDWRRVPVSTGLAYNQFSCLTTTIESISRATALRSRVPSLRLSH